MRLALKNTLFLLAGYAAVLLVLAAVAVFQLLVLQANVQKETARLFAREVAGALAEPSLDRLLQADREARQNLKTLIEQLTRNSQVVSSISVVDRNGRVVASDSGAVDTRQQTPDEFFGASRAMRFITFGRLPFSAGAYELVVPLLQRGERVGYLRIHLQSQSVAEMNQRMWAQLGLSALLGLLCITGLSFALHVQLTQRGKTLARTLEAAIRGETPRISAELDEFSQAIETAGRAGRELHQALSRSAEEHGRFVALGQAVNVGVLLMDPTGRFEYASRRARELFGCDSDEDLTRIMEEIRPALERGLSKRPLSGREGLRIDVAPSSRKDGGQVRLEVYPLGQGAIEGHMVLLRDPATIRALETDMRLASQLRGLARLYLSVVHDIRAPLAAIVAHVELLRGTYENGAGRREDADERARGYLAVVDQELQRLRRSLDSLLNHAALPRDDLEEMDARDMVREVENLLRPQCTRQKVQLSVSLPETPVRVLGSRDALKQALINLGINALEAMPGGGTLDMSLDGQDSKAMISVVDNGPGIPPEIRDKIFTMHFTTKGSGTGIGLYVARAVVEANGGELRVRSEVGQGATFQVELPTLGAGV
jgi:signal transduction histidine kinase/uncharacterized membrane protein affecting hemolysin expression